MEVKRFNNQIYFNNNIFYFDSYLPNDNKHEKGYVIFFNQKDTKKIIALQPLINKYSKEQLENLSKGFIQSPHQSIFSLMNELFNKHCGWFFKNGNK
jgi:c-di-GMP-related signal transduction protein